MYEFEKEALVKDFSNEIDKLEEEALATDRKSYERELGNKKRMLEKELDCIYNIREHKEYTKF